MNEIRKIVVKKILTMCKRANAGHIGSCLSCVEILIDLFFQRMRPEDKFILSKGHAAAALYATLEASGAWLDLDTFYKDGTVLAAHPPCQTDLRIPQIPFGTGSLGHGLSLATGLALAAKLRGEKHKTYCLLSDGDCNEGSTWEAALFAAHHHMSNLIVIVDQNDIQAFGTTFNVLDVESLAHKFDKFNFETKLIIHGNDFAQIRSVLDRFDPEDPKPKCLIARTIKGHGVSFMENSIDWHYLPMNDEQFAQALAETEAME